MRIKHAEPSRRRSRAAAAGYPNPSDRRPTYTYGTFRPGHPDERLYSLEGEALLGIRDDAGTAGVGMLPHRHADVKAVDGHAFMFGVAREQSPLAIPAEPAFYFWDVGSA